MTGFRFQVSGFRRLLLLTAHCSLLISLAGCCSHPGAFLKAQSTLKFVQGFYDPLVAAHVSDNTSDTVKLAVLAADAALAIAGEAQTKWCPDPAEVQKAEAEAQKAKELAAQAGVKEAQGQ